MTYRTVLDAQIAQRRWTAEETVRAFAEQARVMRVSATLSPGQLKRWRRGQVQTPRPGAARVAEALFESPIEVLLASPAAAAVMAVVTSAAASTPPAAAAGSPGAQGASGQGWSAGLVSGSMLEEREIMAAAHDGTEHAAFAAAGVVDATTLEHLREQVLRLAGAYAAAAPLTLFGELRRARELAYRLLERTARPAQTADLYLISGQLSVLLATTSFDLGSPAAATEQGRAALTYGELIDSPPLRAAARAVMAMVAFWDGRPGDGVRHAEAGLRDARTGDIAVRLHSINARSWALAGGTTQARDQLAAAQDARDTAGPDTFAHELGGQFTFGPARQALSVGSTYLTLGDGIAATAAAQAAVERFADAPTDQRWIGGAAAARVDLATAQILVGDVTGARETLTPVLDMPAQYRSESVTARARALRARLPHSPATPSGASVGALAGDLEEFLALTGAAPAALNAAP